MKNVKIPKAFSEIFKKYRVKTFYGGRGSAKSESVGRYLLLDGAQKTQNIVCGREFQSSIKESVHSMLEYLVQDMKLTDFYNVMNNEIRGKNGTLFTFVGVRNNAQNIKSMHNISKFWGEEAQTFSQRSLDIIFPTIRAKDSELIFTMNPILDEDPSYITLIESPPPDSLIVKVNYTENPFFPDELEELRLHHKKIFTKEKYENIWLGKCMSAVEGAIFAEEMRIATEEGRISKIPYQEGVAVDTYWDLGESDLTAIWFVQKVGFDYYFIDYFSSNHKKMPFYFRKLQNKPYIYGTHFLPHDAKQNHQAADRTIYEQAEAVLKNVEGVERPHKKSDPINEARTIFSHCHFDKTNCADGISCLRRYHYRMNEESGSIGKEPDHDIFSHGSDAFLTFAVGRRENVQSQRRKIYRNRSRLG